MQIRWSAAIALWTILGGPVLNDCSVQTSSNQRESAKPATVAQATKNLARQIGQGFRGLNVFKY